MDGEDKQVPILHDRIVVTGGPEVGLEGELVCIDGKDAIVKDSNGQYEVVELACLAKRGEPAGTKPPAKMKDEKDAGLLSKNGRTWEENYALLLKFYQEHGHANVPHYYKEDPKLGHWLANLRRKKHSLSAEKVAKLEALNFTWDHARRERENQQWAAMFQCLEEYKLVEGDCNVPNRYPPNRKLGIWVQTQRMSYRRGKMTPDRIAKLEALKITWNGVSKKQRYDPQWEAMFQCLQEYQEETGHCCVPKTYNPKLANWVNIQRQYYKSGKLTSDRIAKLEALKITWNGVTKKQQYDPQWEDMFQCLQEYQEETGHCCVPKTYNSKLQNWVQTQRMNYHWGKMTPDRIAKLEALNFTWDAVEMKDIGLLSNKRRTWEENYALLFKFYQEHGHANVSHNYKEDPKLFQWLENQQKRKRSLSPEKVAKLDALNITWVHARRERENQHWAAMFQCLEEYKLVKGDCDVPNRYPPNRKLGRWVQAQRMSYRQGKMTPDRIAKLEALKITWNGVTKKQLYDPYWEAMFQCLQEYQEETGHCCVPKTYNPKLQNWVQTQRKSYHLGKMTPDRMAKLEALNITWDKKQLYDQQWEAMFQCLQEYQEETGHCFVPKTHNPKLANWVYVQRQYYKSGKLTSDQITMLESIGFDWRPVVGRKGDYYLKKQTQKERECRASDRFERQYEHGCDPPGARENPKVPE